MLESQTTIDEGTGRAKAVASGSGLALLLLAFFMMPQEARAQSLASSFAPKGTGSLDHSDFSNLLASYVVKGSDGVNRVRYRALKAKKGALEAYLDRMQKVNVRSLSSQAAKAYWINLYNAKTLDVILDHYPVKSIRDIKLGGGFFGSGPWKKKLLTVGGKKLSLDDVEHQIARKTWKDPRLHYGFNCASIGCPNLMKTAYSGKKINAQLDAAARAYINHPRGVAATKSGIKASKIYDWYDSDFGSKAQLIRHWQRYAKPALAQALNKQQSIRGYAYDWSLNDAR
ncbi:MAG: DUF547 domain-containing protein [Cohaesibacter sp.]|jgi:hypothetical protein|nr:DUF547 domain-containing protein [Cohaesibacter sp.]